MSHGATHSSGQPQPRFQVDDKVFLLQRSKIIPIQRAILVVKGRQWSEVLQCFTYDLTSGGSLVLAVLEADLGAISEGQMIQ